MKQLWEQQQQDIMEAHSQMMDQQPSNGMFEFGSKVTKQSETWKPPFNGNWMSLEPSPPEPRSRTPLQEHPRYSEIESFTISTPDLITFDDEEMKPASATKDDLRAEIMQLQTATTTARINQEAQLLQFEASKTQMEMSWAQRQEQVRNQETQRAQTMEKEFDNQMQQRTNMLENKMHQFEFNIQSQANQQLMKEKMLIEQANREETQRMMAQSEKASLEREWKIKSMAEQEIANTKEQTRLELEQMQAQMAHNQQMLENQKNKCTKPSGKRMIQNITYYPWNSNKKKKTESDSQDF